MAVSAGVAADITFRIILNTTEGGTPSFTDFDTNTSVVQTDTAGTTISGGREIYSCRLNATGGGGGSGAAAPFSLDGLNLVINPGDAITISAVSSTGTPSVYASMGFIELT